MKVRFLMTDTKYKKDGIDEVNKTEKVFILIFPKSYECMYSMFVCMNDVDQM